jgi:hypothetical protein
MRNGAELGFCHREARSAVAIFEPGDCFRLRSSGDGGRVASLALTAVR